MSELTCRDVIGLLVDYLDQALGPETVKAFEEHLEDCPPCRAYLNTYQRTRELTGLAGRVAMPEEMKERLRQFLGEHLGRSQP